MQTAFMIGLSNKILIMWNLMIFAYFYVCPESETQVLGLKNNQNLYLLQPKPSSNCIIYDSNNIFTILWFKIGQNIWDQLSFETNTDTNILVPEIGLTTKKYAFYTMWPWYLDQNINMNFPSNVTWSSYTLESPHPHIQPFFLVSI